jgi:hypothetical protein
MTNPDFGRGTCLELRMRSRSRTPAQRLATTLSTWRWQPRTDPELLEQQFLYPLVRDAARPAIWAGAPTPPPSGLTPAEIAAAAATDAHDWRLAVRRFNLLDAPEVIFDDDVMSEVVAGLRRAAFSTIPQGPSRAQPSRPSTQSLKHSVRPPDL